MGAAAPPPKKIADGGQRMERPASGRILARTQEISPGMPEFCRKAEGRTQNEEGGADAGGRASSKPPKATQSHFKATCKPSTWEQRATLKPPQSHPKAKCKPSASQEIGRYSRIPFVFPSYSLSIFLLFSGGALRRPTAAPPNPCQPLTVLVCPIFKRNHFIFLLPMILARAHFARILLDRPPGERYVGGARHPR